MKQHLLLLLLSGLLSAFARAQTGPVTDTAKAPPAGSLGAGIAADTGKAPKPPYVHQFRIGFDISRIAFNLADKTKQGYEIQADYLLRNAIYLVAETGFGNGKVDYDNLQYDNSGYFFKFGVDKSFLDIVSKQDFDIGFIGARYGIGSGKRSEAAYFVASPFGPPAEGKVPRQNFIVHWGEITGGIKVELGKGIFAGWNARMRFLLNAGVFKELAPNYIPGYGKGDKSTSFDFNFYLSYAIRWGGK